MLNYISPRNTLAGQLGGRPLTTPFSLGGQTIAAATERLGKYWVTIAGMDVRCPIDCALQFYALSHAVGVLQQKYDRDAALPDSALEVLNLYHTRGMELALEAYLYLFVICAREARHCPDKDGMPTIMTAGLGIPPDRMQAFLHSVPDSADVPAVLQVARHHLGLYPLPHLTTALCRLYYHGDWGSSFGGPLWGMVTEVLHRFVSGETSAALLLDTVWTLAHNCAPIFNKGFVYKIPDEPALQQMLNVQHMGQVPNFLLHGASFGAYAKAVKIAKELATLMGADFDPGKGVDWTAVNALPVKDLKNQKTSIKAAGKKKFPIPQGLPSFSGAKIGNLSLATKDRPA